MRRASASIVASLAALACSVALAQEPPRLPYAVVDTGQSRIYGASAPLDSVPKAGEPFYGQDGQYRSHPAAYTLSDDGLTVHDAATGLTWQRSPDTNGDGSLTFSDKLTLKQAQARPAALNVARFGGFSDWRLPTIKELYSLVTFDGTDPSGPAVDTSALVPFIDRRLFRFAYGDTSAGERIIDSQYASSTVYADHSTADGGKVFGVNFADGRIKGYGLKMPGGAEKTFFVICVRGNPKYGLNDLHDGGSGTVFDRATGLTWAKADSGTAMDWQHALAWVQEMNKAKHLGQSDWRLPSAKELQSIVDYSRAPGATQSPAVDPLFKCTQIKNEAGQTDYPCYWTSTTHISANGWGPAAAYVAFGRGMGYMNGAWRDVHGAGCQRSDPKEGDPASFPTGRGPQGDAIRIQNYVRLVRTTDPTAIRAVQPNVKPASPASAAPRSAAGGNGVYPGIMDAAGECIYIVRGDTVYVYTSSGLVLVKKAPLPK